MHGKRLTKYPSKVPEMRRTWKQVVTPPSPHHAPALLLKFFHGATLFSGEGLIWRELVVEVIHHHQIYICPWKYDHVCTVMTMHVQISKTISIYVSMYLCIYVSTHLCIYISMYLYTYLSMYLCMYVCIYLSIYLSVYLSIDLLYRRLDIWWCIYIYI